MWLIIMDLSENVAELWKQTVSESGHLGLSNAGKPVYTPPSAPRAGFQGLLDDIPACPPRLTFKGDFDVDYA